MDKDAFYAWIASHGVSLDQVSQLRWDATSTRRGTDVFVEITSYPKDSQGKIVVTTDENGAPVPAQDVRWVPMQPFPTAWERAAEVPNDA
jgi:hypothetical protein